MQLSRSSILEVCLAPHGRAIHLARVGLADHGQKCPFMGVKRSRRLRAGNGVIDPNVWSGRALQEVFIDLAVSGLASMYPALAWSALCSWPSWISARVRSH